MEFRPTAPSFNPSTASVSAASPSPIARTASVARTSSPSSFFGQRKPKKPSERLDMMKKFNPIPRMQDEVKAEVAKKADTPARDYKPNGGIPNAFHTQPIWMVAEENQEKPWDESFNRPPSVSPAPHRHAGPFPGQMQPMMGMPLMQQGLGPQHGHHAGHHFPQAFDDQRMHMQNGTPQVFTPNMTPRSQFVSPMSHHAQPVYGQQAYFMGNRNMPMQAYGGNPAMMHGQHGQMVAPMMVSQHSSGPYMNMQNQPGMMYSPAPAHVYPQHIPNGYPSPGRQMQAPAMMHQNSQQSYHGGPQMMYPTGGPQYGQQAQMRGGYAGGHTPYGTSPHQPHAMNQRAMSSGYMQKVMPQMAANGGPPANAPQQPAAFGQMPVSEEAK